MLCLSFKFQKVRQFQFGAVVKRIILKRFNADNFRDLSERDINRTFLASPSDFKTINIHGLHPGHQYRLGFE